MFCAFCAFLCFCVHDVFWCVLCVWAKLPEIKLDADDDELPKITVSVTCVTSWISIVPKHSITQKYGKIWIHLCAGILWKEYRKIGFE